MRRTNQNRGMGGPLWPGLVAWVSLLLLTATVVSGQTLGWDRPLLLWLAAQRTPLWDGFFAGVTWLGSFYLLGPAVLGVSLGLARRGLRPSAWVLAAGFYGTALLTFLLKRLVGRDRPELGDPALYALPMDGAFPSGHTAHAVAAALGLWWLTRRHWPRWQWPVASVLGSLAVLVGISRLYLQVHWPSDVGGGALLAIAWCAGVFGLAHLREAGRHP